jgi:hypothetical protein
VRFLDHAAECVFLYKVGGGYRFVHEQLQEYFASRAGAQRAAPGLPSAPQPREPLPS